MEDNKVTPPATKPKFSKRILFVIVSIVLVLAVVLAAVLVNKKPTPKPTSNANELIEDGSQQTDAEMSDYKQEVQVFITANGISPETLIIPKDTRIIWENKDTVAHKIAILPGTNTPPKFFNSRLIDVGGGYPYVVHDSMTFHYYVVDHPTQNGTVIVK